MLVLLILACLAIVNIFTNIGVDWWTLGIAAVVTSSIPIIDNEQYIRDLQSLQRKIDNLKQQIKTLQEAHKWTEHRFIGHDKAIIRARYHAQICDFIQNMDIDQYTTYDFDLKAAMKYANSKRVFDFRFSEYFIENWKDVTGIIFIDESFYEKISALVLAYVHDNTDIDYCCHWEKDEASNS